MAKDSIGGKRGASASATVSATPSQQQTLNQVAQSSNGNFDDNYATQLRQKYDDLYDPDVVGAIKLYITDRPDSQGYTISQNLNYALDNKLPLNVNEAFIDKYIGNGMHNIDTQATLTRACHDDVLQKLGIKDYTKLTEKQLQQKLIGVEYDTTAYTSYSYDASRNPFIPGNKYSGTNQDKSGGREVIMKTTTDPSTKMVFGASKQAEVIMNKGTHQRIKNVYFSGNTATPRLKGTRPVVVIETETF